jgi:hypothetical protein
MNGNSTGDVDSRTEDIKLAPRRVRGRAPALRRRSLGQRLFHWGELPEYLRDNEFIKSGYRANTGFRGSLRSLFSLHNESGNVWTHLLGTYAASRSDTLGRAEPAIQRLS